jgi:hypothetical protein
MITKAISNRERLKKYPTDVQAALFSAAGQLAHADLLLRQQGVDQSAMARSFNSALEVLFNNVLE